MGVSQCSSVVLEQMMPLVSFASQCLCCGAFYLSDLFNANAVLLLSVETDTSSRCGEPFGAFRCGESLGGFACATWSQAKFGRPEHYLFYHISWTLEMHAFLSHR